jgi:SAM-dependent methyltransferase
MSSNLNRDLTLQYQKRFGHMAEYRNRVWQILIAGFFGNYVRPDAVVLDLGCGWCEFINNIPARTKYAMDLNADVANRVGPNTTVMIQDCSEPWNLPDDSLDVIFSSNFFEHLPTKEALSRTVGEARRCLKPDGLLICMGPNIRLVPGAYWDFWDHYIPLTEHSLVELLKIRGYRIQECIAKFVPYTMVNRRPPPLFLIKMYLRLRWVWRIFGKQFVVIAQAGK